MKPETCVHFTGIMNPSCAAGVNYEALAGGEAFGMWKRIPCGGNTGTGVVACASRTLPTAEEIAAEEAEEQASKQRYIKIFAFVGEWRKRPPRGKHEVVTCPACGGRLHLAQAACNGHVHGKCETAGCASWME